MGLGIDENINTYYKVTVEQLIKASEFEEKKRKNLSDDKQYLLGEPEPEEGKIETKFIKDDDLPDTDAIPISIVSREEWGALPRPGGEEVFTAKVPFVHQELNSGTSQCYSFEECSRIVREIQRRDKELGYSDIRYNFLVGDDWNVYEGRGWYVTPEKTNELPKYHAKYYEVALIGNMNRPNHPTFLQSKMLWSVFKKGLEELKVMDDQNFTLIMKNVDFYPNLRQAA
uniref:Peptidoglycan recognition protein 3 n=1 Tax=Nephotettix cincticeps TaxID=94400 RepID=A0A5H2WY89_NEPCI|nr:peptidoglycan recognition protein 3 [Nephotettix cincticeps]